MQSERKSKKKNFLMYCGLNMINTNICPQNLESPTEQVGGSWSFSTQSDIWKLLKVSRLNNQCWGKFYLLLMYSLYTIHNKFGGGILNRV